MTTKYIDLRLKENDVQIKVENGALVTTSEGANSSVTVSGVVSVVCPANSVSSAISGQITVVTSGTAIQGPNVTLPNGVFIRALSTNGGSAYVGNNGAGDVDSTNGYELSAGDEIVVAVANLNELWFDAAANGYKFCWLKA